MSFRFPWPDGHESFGTGTFVYDAGFKKMFSHPRMIELVIRRHVPEWAEQLDYSTLEKLPTELIGDKLLKRHADLLWRGVTKGGSTELLLLMEFQDRPEFHMALRTTVYSGLAAKELLEHRKARGEPGRELAVISLVLYHGDRPWNVPVRAADLLSGSSLDTYRIVSRRPPGAPDPEPLDLPEMVLGLAGEWTVDKMRLELPRLRKLVQQCGDEGFDRFMARTVVEMLVLRGISKERLEEAMTMETVVSAFERGLSDLVRQGREQGIRQGREQGIRQGREQGQAQVLLRMAAHKFGMATSTELSGMLTRYTAPDRVDPLVEVILECDSPEEFLKRVRSVLSDSQA